MAALPGLTSISLRKEWTKAPGVSQLASLKELAHLCGESGGCVDAVEEVTLLRQQPSRLHCGDLQPLLLLAGHSVRGVDVQGKCPVKCSAKMSVG